MLKLSGIATSIVKGTIIEFWLISDTSYPAYISCPVFIIAQPSWKLNDFTIWKYLYV